MVPPEQNLETIPIVESYLSDSEEKNVRQVLRSGWLSQGRAVQEFENKIAKYTQAKYAIAVSSGTTALHLALLVSGIGPGDEVIIPSFSFIATANAILYSGAKPVFIDIDPRTYNVDPEGIDRFIKNYCRLKNGVLVNRNTGANVKAIMPVHQFGLPCDLDAINHLAKEYNLLVIEDAACALGSRYKRAKIGNGENIACFSFHPRKVLTMGEGGIITTNDKLYAEKANALRNHGINPPNQKKKPTKLEGYKILGYNYRLTDLQAAIGLAQLSKLPEILNKRRIVAKYYDEAFKELNCIRTPYTPTYASANYQSYVIRREDNCLISRDCLIKILIKNGISVRQGNTAIHLQPLYRKNGFNLPNTEQAVSNSIALPIFPGLSRSRQEYVIKKVLSLIKR